MVSFQCHACGDVVKKPKLDQHRGRCHSGFDCIDCHTTFNGPREYKGHTQCISEAEKYQKSLYKGPKVKSFATSSNNEPLGAPTRVFSTRTTLPPAAISPNPSPATDVGDNNQNAADLDDVPTREKKKSKKRKHALADNDGQDIQIKNDEPKKKKPKRNQTVISPDPPVTLPPSPVELVDDALISQHKGKKDRKDKKERKVEEIKTDVVGEQFVEEQGERRKDKKKSKKNAEANVEVTTVDGETSGKEKQSKKSRKEKHKRDPSPDMELGSKPKKSHRAKTKQVDADVTGGEIEDRLVVTDLAEIDGKKRRKEKRKEEKKHRKDRMSNGLQVADT